MSFLNNTDKNWTLFLDRDGVLNIEKENDYIRNIDEFILYEKTLDAFKLLKDKFHKIIVVTNQRGIGKGLMTHEHLHDIHNHFQNLLKPTGCTIDAFYYAPELDSNALNRKPNTGMALQAKNDFPSIDFSKSIMVGNNLSDMQFGKNMGMKTVFVQSTNPGQQSNELIDLLCPSFYDFAIKIL